MVAFSLVVLLAGVAFGAETAPPPGPPVGWTSSIGAGLTLTRGNTDTTNINVAFTTKYEPGTRYLFKADALLLKGDSDGVRQTDKAAASARGEYTLSDRTFAFVEVSYLRDPFKDIDYLVAPVVGAGYRVIRSDTRNLTVDGAVGFQMESGGIEGRTTSGAIKGGESYDLVLSPSSKFTQKLTGLWKTNDFADALYHLDAGLTTTVTKRMELKVALNYDYKARPPAGIEKGDSALFAALLFKF